MESLTSSAAFLVDTPPARPVSLEGFPGLPGNPIASAVLPKYVTDPGQVLKDNWIYVAGFTFVLGALIGYGIAPKGGN